MDAAECTKEAERLHRELIEQTKDQPWKTLALIRINRRGEWFYEFKYDLGKAMVDPEFIGFCSMQTSRDQLVAMLKEASAEDEPS